MIPHPEMFISGADRTEIGRYCGDEKPGIIETMTNEAIVQFKSDNFEFRHYRGFSLKYSSSPESESVVSSFVHRYNLSKRSFQVAAVN